MKEFPCALPVFGIVSRSFAEKRPANTFNPPLQFCADLALTAYGAYGKEVVSEINQLIEVLVSSNKRASVHQKKDISFLMFSYGEVLSQFFSFMGLPGVIYLQALAKQSVLKFERELKLLCSLKGEFFTMLLTEYRKEKAVDDIKPLVRCYILLGFLLSDSFLELVGAGVADSAVEVNTFVPECIKKVCQLLPEEAYIELCLELFNYLFLGNVSLVGREALVNVINNTTHKQLINLAFASRAMGNDSYKAIYLELLQRDLFGGDVSQFLHDPEQKSPLGVRLAKHNQNIRGVLSEHEIDPDRALNYRGSFSITFYPDAREE